MSDELTFTVGTITDEKILKGLTSAFVAGCDSLELVGHFRGIPVFADNGPDVRPYLINRPAK